MAPEQFDRLREKAEAMGFLYVASGPFVRSSYRAGELFLKGILNREAQKGRAHPLTKENAHASHDA